MSKIHTIKLLFVIVVFSFFFFFLQVYYNSRRLLVRYDGDDCNPASYAVRSLAFLLYFLSAHPIFMVQNLRCYESRYQLINLQVQQVQIEISVQPRCFYLLWSLLCATFYRSNFSDQKTRSLRYTDSGYNGLHLQPCNPAKFNAL